MVNELVSHFIHEPFSSHVMIFLHVVPECVACSIEVVFRKSANYAAVAKFVVVCLLRVSLLRETAKRQHRGVVGASSHTKLYEKPTASMINGCAAFH